MNITKELSKELRKHPVVFGAMGATIIGLSAALIHEVDEHKNYIPNGVELSAGYCVHKDTVNNVTLVVDIKGKDGIYPLGTFGIYKKPALAFENNPEYAREQGSSLTTKTIDAPSDSRLRAITETGLDSLTNEAANHLASGAKHVSCFNDYSAIYHK